LNISFIYEIVYFYDGSESSTAEGFFLCLFKICLKGIELHTSSYPCRAPYIILKPYKGEKGLTATRNF